MNSLSLHPATLRLLRYQAAARFSKMLRGFRGRRRLILSILGAVLAVAWIGQAVAGLLFREPADPQKLQVWIPLALLAYTLWHLLKAACRTPIEPFEWTPTEKELLGGAPLLRSELVMYRLAAIAVAAVAKALCFSLVMLPDLQVWAAGLVGMLLALLFVDLLRMAIEIFAYGISSKAFYRFRLAVLVVAGACVVSTLVRVYYLPEAASQTSLPGSLAIALRFGTSLMELRTTWFGVAAETPFRVFGGVILAPGITPVLLGLFLLTVTMVAGMMKAVVWLDWHFLQRRVAAERKRFGELLTPGPGERKTFLAVSQSVRVPRRLRGAGSLAWRQLRGALHYRTSVLIALIVPAGLSCLALLRPKTDLAMVIELVGSLVFYSFLLLPAALKFDFRRDVDRLATIKALPISPTAVTVGQLAVPVLLCTLFQLAVLLLAMAARPYHPGMLIVAMIVLVPVNALIFALENLIFMLYPYRVNQEGIGVFLRSILTFTGKGLLFAIGLALTLAWALVSRPLGEHLFSTSDWVGRSVVFAVGMWAMISAIAAATTALLIRVYRGFDPSQDTPAMS